MMSKLRITFDVSGGLDDYWDQIEPIVISEAVAHYAFGVPLIERILTRARDNDDWMFIEAIEDHLIAIRRNQQP